MNDSALVRIQRRPQGLPPRQRADRRPATGINLEIPPGDFLALMGPSGSGKTTLLNLIGGLDRPTAGAIEVGGRARSTSLSGGQLAKWRARHVGFVFQFYNLLPVLTAERNVELPLLLTTLSAAERRQHVADRARRWSASPTARSTTRGSSPAARSSASASRARSSPTRRCCSATSRPAISTASRPTRSSTCCRRSTASTARRSSWSRTIRTPRPAPGARCISTRATSSLEAAA